MPETSAASFALRYWRGSNLFELADIVESGIIGGRRFGAAALRLINQVERRQ